MDPTTERKTILETKENPRASNNKILQKTLEEERIVRATNGTFYQGPKKVQRSFSISISPPEKKQKFSKSKLSKSNSTPHPLKTNYTDKG